MEWYTPSNIVELARQVMGGIDLDPASTPSANGIVKADKFYTVEDDGLKHPWYGRVWLNPPYKQPLVRRFTEAAIQKYRAGEIAQAIILVNNGTETRSLQGLFKAASAVCFPKGRIRFLDTDGNPVKTPLQGQAVFYFGHSVSHFIGVFSDLGAALPLTAHE